ncbi:helix-turn-helix domain-containing protein [Macrococcoides caseolyticum]|uniref:Phage repressor protein n=1 Tax=Macrococcoides caseolyticum TaxID=69966 RepID=A0ACC9MQH8_9STAP|nr:helix-turn-helix domain-containing protein [Macrococcus caseolyticus]PKE07342.1 phage repressor protein [Macrococcus caseolyticus]PKE17800.1 phage repressor protein [Macrococcus caseolyticus]PKE34666.1 phage repressor protein [Macrococcus caseolyticus]PKE38531.1 phage repressor protein [Macrococcus caseolyticus]PKE45319.1 phage repressor protein [Macrococcus caseolyticus]
MVDIKELKKMIASKGYNLEQFAEKIGMGRSTLYRKMKDNGNNFTIGEIETIVKILKLTKKESISIFFIN